MAKDPCIKDWRNRASTDPALILAWAAEFPGCLWGIELGRSGLVVIDADRHGGPDGVEALAALGPLPPHPVIQTRSGGFHHQFRQPNPPVRRQIPWRPGIDLLAAGAFAAAYATFKLDDVPVLPEVFRGAEEQPHTPGVAPPRTTNPHGRARSLFEIITKRRNEPALHWAACRFAEMVAEGVYPRERAAKVCELAATSCGLTREIGIDAVRTTIANGLEIIDRRIESLIQTVATATEGTRNNTLYWVAIEVLRLSPQAEDLLFDAGYQCGLDDREIRATIASAWRERDQVCGG